MTKPRAKREAPRPWSMAEIDRLRRDFPNSRTDDLAKALGRSYSTTAQKAYHLGLKKTEAYLSSPAAHRLDGAKGMGTRFEKGLTPWNKGTKGVCGTQEACRATQFKKGRPPHESRNYKPIGSLRIVDGTLERKVSDDPSVYPARRWTPVARLVWEEAHGPIPEKHLVRFKPGMATVQAEEITVDRLECVSRAEHMRTHTYHQYGPEVASVVQLRGAISRQINKRSKETT